MTAQPTLPARVLPSIARHRGNRFGFSWHIVSAALVIADAVALLAAFSLAYLVRFKAGVPFLETPPYSLAFYSSLAFWAVPGWLGLFALYQLYNPHSLFEGANQYIRAINACTVGLIVIVVISFLEPALLISRGWLLLTWLLSIVLVCGIRFSLRRVLVHLRRRGHFLSPTVIVGVNEEGLALAEQFNSDPSCGLRVVGFVTGSVGPAAVVGDVTVLGTVDDLIRLVPLAPRLEVREVVVATTGVSRAELLDLFRVLGHSGLVKLRLSSGLFDILTTGMKVQDVGCVSLMTLQRLRITGVDALLKTTLDYLGAAVLLLCLSPLMALIAALVKLDSPGPVFHRRRVLGQSGRVFDALKFRTMVPNADAILAADAALSAAFAQGHKLKNDPRVTRLGRLLRRTSLDELPQLINVLRGEMSLVGPRMITPDEATRYGKWQLNLLTVKPGITGPWQVQGRNDIAYEERVRLSMHYIRNYSIWLDLELLLKTVGVVLQGKGAY